MEEENDEERKMGRKRRRRRRQGKSSVSAGLGDSSCSAAVFTGCDVTAAAGTSIATPRRLEFTSRTFRQVKKLPPRQKQKAFGQSDAGG